ncbi:aspartate/glutamate racemase family protein [Alkalimonas delamerensis]|uniref:Aspartate/glutamate racemase family protein n=1 Tax=Alkalimonas delamerensis TaxID=265981 RepID=A0ABT9GPS7_9GAMM|nr:aspartate/glutamate racemase family protein [Alkalimonas delamerensis]MDP4528980.1 aspartate/glutamate racemase family protein [Alkalimonas delamerensis]
MNKKLIIIMGGMGPVASAQLNLSILKEHAGANDQDYPSIIHVSIPEWIPDRTSYVLGFVEKNPGIICADIVNKTLLGLAESFGQILVVIPCFTFHSSVILSSFYEAINTYNGKVVIVNMVDTTIDYMKSSLNSNDKLVIWSTKGSHAAKVWSSSLEQLRNIEVVSDDHVVLGSHNIVYNDKYGLKAHPFGNAETSKEINQLFQQSVLAGATKVLLGCTEYSTFFSQGNVPNDFKEKLVDPFEILIHCLSKSGLILKRE